MFRKYIIAFARQAGVELTGDPIVLGNNGAELMFLGTNANTAQSHNGDLYVDEIFWIPNFQKLKRVAGGMSSQEHLRTTYFSTPHRWRTELTRSGRVSSSTRGAQTRASESISISVTPHSRGASPVLTASGDRLSPSRTHSPKGARCSTSIR